MSKITLLVLSIILLFNSCKKIKGDAEEIIGTYEWAYSYTYICCTGSHGSGSYTHYTYPDSLNRNAIKIEKRKIIFFENGKEVERFSIRKISISESSISLRFQRKKEDTYLTWYKNQKHLTTTYFPTSSSEEHHVYYKN